MVHMRHAISDRGINNEYSNSFWSQLLLMTEPSYVVVYQLNFQTYKHDHHRSRLFTGVHNFMVFSARYPTNRTILRSGFQRPLLRPQRHLGKYPIGLISVGAARRWTQQLQCSRRTTVVSRHDSSMLMLAPFNTTQYMHEN